MVVLIRALFALGMPRVGGKIGRRQKISEAESIPDGFSGVYARSMRLSVASAEATKYSRQKDFLRKATREIPKLMRIYCIASCRTEIEIPAEPPDYDRIDAGEALALLGEMPDLRLVRRLHLSDEPCYLDPWMRKVSGQDVRLLGHASNFRLIALYRPDRRFRREVGLTLLHEWLHIVAFKHEIDLWRFGRANIVEPLAPAPFDGASGRTRKLPHEAWADVGEKLLGYEDTLVRQTAWAFPVHAMILWGRIEAILRHTPTRLRSTRFAEFQRRAEFMRVEVAARATAARKKRG